MHRELEIELFEDLSVSYKFSRENLSEYFIEYPDEKTIIHETENLRTDNYGKQITSLGIKLFWDKITESKVSSENRYLHYTKLNFMRLYQENPKIIGYKEKFNIKGSSNTNKPEAVS